MKPFSSQTGGQKLRGVNLGSWLLLEKWMVPSVFKGLQATDETSWCVELGARAEPLLKHHWNTFIKRNDFAWLAGIGINAVRIPLGYWIFGPHYPYHRAYGGLAYPFVVGGIDILDQAFDWAEEYELHVVLDLHAAPGCQNGFDNGGILGVCEWSTREDYIEHSLSVLERLAERYCRRPSLHVIEVLNEPRWDIDTDRLKRYTCEGYQRIRKCCRPEEVAVIFHEGFRSFREYLGFMQPPEFNNVVFDIHRYQCFEPADIDADIYRHLEKTATDWKNEADAIITELGLGAYVGEWNLGMKPRAVSPGAKTRNNYGLEHLDEFQTNVAYRAYAAAQLATFEKYLGWFFWSYKTETTPERSFRECVRRGWLPDTFK